MICRKQLEQLVTKTWIALEVGPDCWILLVDDSVAAAIDQHIRGNHACQRHNLAGKFHGIAHRQRVRMAWNGNEVLRLEDRSLVQDPAAYLCQRQTVCGGNIVVE